MNNTFYYKLKLKRTRKTIELYEKFQKFINKKQATKNGFAQLITKRTLFSLILEMVRVSVSHWFLMNKWNAIVVARLSFRIAANFLKMNQKASLRLW